MILNVSVAAVAVILTVIACATLWWMMHALRSPETYEAIGEPFVGDPQLSFSIIVPCRDESEEVMAETIGRLTAQRHPDVEIIISVGHDDLPTIRNARSIAAGDDRIRVSINDEPVKNKPRQLNSSLRECTKSVVGIIDAESLTEPTLLARIDTAFATQGADVVQGAVHLVNLRSRWFSLRNCLEYRIWFRSRLHGHARKGFLPLGGNTVFVRRALLEEVGGWDGDCLAEDAELGVRLSAMGKKTVCVYESDLVTREETPDTVSAFIKQRTRWSLGFMQVLAKGEWRRLPTAAERCRAVWLLMQQYTCAFAGLVLPLAVVTAVLGDRPVLIVLLSFLPLVPTILTVSFELLVLHEFGRDLGVPVTARDYVRLVVTTPVYQLLLAIASIRAVWKYISGDFGWEKTGHAGAHLNPRPVVALAADGAR